MTGPLEGLEIVECASFVAGPTRGMTLAQLGASVIRIDPLGGGPDHGRWPAAGDGTGESYYWASLNKGKRSVTVDMRSEEGRELVLALATAPGADRGLLIDNVVGRRWMSDEVLRARRPDLVHLRVQGYPDGRPAVDYTVNAEVGVPQITGGEDRATPVNHVLPAWDLVTGLTVSTGVLAGLRRRERTGHGVFGELALSDVALAGVANLGWISEAAERGQDRPRLGNHVYGSFGVDFGCADGERVMVVALTPAQWGALVAVTRTEAVFAALEEALGTDLTAEQERYRLRDTIAAVLKPWFLARDSGIVTEELNEARVLWSRYRGMAEVAESHRAGELDVLADLTLPDGASGVTARSPLRWNGSYGPVGTAPGLGEHTEDVLAEVLGIGTAEFSGLVDRGVVAAPGVAADGSSQR